MMAKTSTSWSGTYRPNREVSPQQLSCSQERGPQALGVRPEELTIVLYQEGPCSQKLSSRNLHSRRTPTNAACILWCVMYSGIADRL